MRPAMAMHATMRVRARVGVGVGVGHAVWVVVVGGVGVGVGCARACVWQLCTSVLSASAAAGHCCVLSVLCAL
jgi:hypothetical protein